MKNEPKSLSPYEIRKLVKAATPEARWKRHSVWIKANKRHLAETVFNKLDESQKKTLQSAVNSYIDQSWIYSEQLDTQASDCLQGKITCGLGVKYNLTKNSVTEGDKRFMQKFLLEQSFPVWADRCDKLDPNCSSEWKAAIEPILSQPNKRL